MENITTLVSQKGGVAKSTLTRALVREAAANGLKVKLADLDAQQVTSTPWHQCRLDNGVQPVFPVEGFKTAVQALQATDGFNGLVPAGIPKARLVFALCRTGTEAEEAKARTSLTEAGYEGLPGFIPKRPVYRPAQTLGLAMTETRFPQLNRCVDEVLQVVVDPING